MCTDAINDGSDVFILLATGFEEETAVSCMTHLRAAGFPVSLVSLATGPVRGLHGLTINPDQTLSNFCKEISAKMVIIPGNGQCTNALLMAPRFHQLIANTIDNNGYLVATKSAEKALKNAGISQKTPAPQYILQENQDIEQFAGQLVHVIRDESAKG